MCTFITVGYAIICVCALQIIWFIMCICRYVERSTKEAVGCRSDMGVSRYYTLLNSILTCLKQNTVN